MYGVQKREGPVPFLVPYCIGFGTALIVAALVYWIVE